MIAWTYEGIDVGWGYLVWVWDPWVVLFVNPLGGQGPVASCVLPVSNVGRPTMVVLRLTALLYLATFRG